MTYRAFAAAVVSFVAWTALAATTPTDLWFFADFDSMPQLGGDAFMRVLPNAKIVEGRFGKGAEFCSEQTRCENRFWVENDRALLKDFPSERGTFACWYRTPDSVTNRTAKAPAFGLTGFWQFQWQWCGNYFRTSTEKDGYIPLPAFRRTGEWHHFAATWSPNRAAFYIDGEVVAERGNPKLDSIRDIKGPSLRIGSSANGDGAANLTMDEIAIFRKELTGGEVRELATAREGFLAGRRKLLAAPVVLPFFWRDDDRSALRLRVFSETDMAVGVTAEVGGRRLDPLTFPLKRGENKLTVPFKASRYRTGEYPWEVTLTAGQTDVLRRGGTLKIFPRLDRDQFKFMNWGGWHEVAHDFLHKVGVNSRNVQVGDTAGMRRFAGDGAFFPNAMYGNNWLWSRQDVDAPAIRERTLKDFAYLEGLYAWKTTLVNTEVYGTRYPQTATNHPNFHAWAERELGFRPDYRYGTAPSSVIAKFCEDGHLPTGIVQRGECKTLDTLKWVMEKGMFPYLVNAETRAAIRELDADNVVWSEPAAEGVADRLDMMADWHYQYRTSSTLRELYRCASCARAYGKPYMPTLSGTYCHGYCVPRRWSAENKRWESGVQSDDEVAVKAWLSIAAVPAHALSFFMLDAWPDGIRNGSAEPNAGDRFGREWHARIRPAATLLRDLPNERAPFAYVLPKECDLTVGMGWGETHYRDGLADILGAEGLPFDVIGDRELEAGKLKEYPCALLIMAKALYPDHAQRLDEAARAGTKIVTDRYSFKTFENGERLGELFYDHYKWGKISAFFADWYRKLVPSLRERLTARSDGDGADAYTFVKKYDGVAYVTVINNRRSETPGYLNTLVTNSWYRPYCAANTITTHFKLPAGTHVYEFNSNGRSFQTSQTSQTSQTFSYAPMEGKVFCAYPRALKELSVKVEGETVLVSLDDANGQPAPGRQVVEIEVRDPEGNLHDETGRYVMERGRVKIPIRLADDDPKGTFFRRWQVTAKELTTGFTDSCRW